MTCRFGLLISTSFLTGLSTPGGFWRLAPFSFTSGFLAYDKPFLELDGLPTTSYAWDVRHALHVRQLLGTWLAREAQMAQH